MSSSATSETTQRVSGVSTAYHQSATSGAKRPIDFFELDWHAAWIAPVEAAADHLLGLQRPVQQLAAAVNIQGKIVSAQLHVTAHGIYEMFVNGTRVGDEERKHAAGRRSGAG